MSSTSIRLQIAGLEKKYASLEKAKAHYVEKASRSAKEANAKREQAHRSKSENSRRMYLGSAEQATKKYTDEMKKASDASSKIATLRKSIADKTKSLESALKSERDKAERDAKARQRRDDQDMDKRRRAEKDHAREIARLSRPEFRHLIVQAPKPEKLRVLYLTANPDETKPIRVDAEVNNVLKSIRGAKYRDSLDLQVRPAATPQDLIDGINDLRPHVVHFSGHGNVGILAFDNASYDNPDCEIMEFDVLAELLGATSTPPKLLVMNACKTLAGSNILLETVPVLIGMADSVGDAGAGIFASQFYAAIASAQPIGAALRQSKAMMKQALLRDDADLPQIVSRADVDPDDMALIVPQDD